MSWSTADRELLADRLVQLGLDLGVARQFSGELVDCIEAHGLPRPRRCVACGKPVQGLARWCSRACHTEDEVLLRDEALDAMDEWNRELDEFHRYDRSFD